MDCIGFRVPGVCMDENLELRTSRFAVCFSCSLPSEMLSAKENMALTRGGKDNDAHNGLIAHVAYTLQAQGKRVGCQSALGCGC